MIVNDMPTFSKEYAFKLAIVNDLGYTTFDSFIFALRQKMKLVKKFTVHGIDCRGHKFSFNVDSFKVEHNSSCVTLDIHYKWDGSSDKPSNWHPQTLIMTEITYKSYIHDAEIVYMENKPHDDAVSYTVSSGRRNGKYLTSAIVAAIHRKLVEENDISVGDFEGVVDAFTFENYCATFKAYVKSIGYVTAEDHPGSNEKKIELHDLIVCVDEDQGARTDIRIDSVPYYGIHFDIRRGGLTDAITGVHVSKHSNEWVIYRIRRQERLGKAVDLHYLPPVTPVAYNSKDVEFCMGFYNHLNEKETKEMKKDENKIIINHNAVIVYIGTAKAVVSVIDKKTKEETGNWNTKAGVIMAIAKVFGIGTHMYKMYEVLNTISKPTNKTLDFVADEIRLNGKRIKNYKWYHEAINTKRPEPGKQIEIIME